jgi:hypothetical protein
MIALVVAGVTSPARATPSLATMKAALEKGDLDEASRQGVLAGPAVVEAALASPDRATVLAGIAAAPRVEDRAGLLEPLAQIARGADRRTAIPATRAAAQIARELARNEPADDIADADIVASRDRFADIALDRTRWIEVRVLAVDTAVYIERSRLIPAGTSAPGLQRPLLDPAHADGTGVPLAPSLADPDPAIRRIVLAHAPSPLPPELRDPIARAVVSDIDPLVALAAAAVVCADLAFDPAEPILSALGAAGITRVQTIVTTSGAPRGHLREAARCLAADKSPASTAALRKIRNVR